MKLLNWINQRLRKRTPLPASVPPLTSNGNDDVDRLMKAIMGVMGWSQAYLEIMTSLQVAPNTEVAAVRGNEKAADFAKQAVTGMSSVLHEWGDWLDDPSKPMPTIPTAYLATALTDHEATNANSATTAESSSQVA